MQPDHQKKLKVTGWPKKLLKSVYQYVTTLLISREPDTIFKTTIFVFYASVAHELYNGIVASGGYLYLDDGFSIDKHSTPFKGIKYLLDCS
jgi:hypothetical protein